MEMQAENFISIVVSEIEFGNEKNIVIIQRKKGRLSSPINGQP